MKKMYLFLCIILVAPVFSFAQSDPHYTMFMYNKLLFNPAYAGSRNVTSVNAVYRDQWAGIKGAPRTFNVALDGPVGSYMKAYRKVAAGLSFNNEQIGVEKNTNITTYYAYRIKFQKSVVSLGLSAGVKLYTANYDQLNPYQQNDPNLSYNVKNALLPNFGTGVYWSGDRFYMGASIPNLLQNYYDKNEKALLNQKAREIRSYYVNGGYVFHVSDVINLQPQAMVRYSKNTLYKLPLNCDLNLSAIMYNRLLLGVTYRTDQSFEAIMHMQVTKNINLGYAYDHVMSALNGYARGTHEIVIGFDRVRDNSKYTTPRFIKAF